MAISLCINTTTNTSIRFQELTVATLWLACWGAAWSFSSICSLEVVVVLPPSCFPGSPAVDRLRFGFYMISLPAMIITPSLDFSITLIYHSFLRLQYNSDISDLIYLTMPFLLPEHMRPAPLVPEKWLLSLFCCVCCHSPILPLPPYRYDTNTKYQIQHK